MEGQEVLSSQQQGGSIASKTMELGSFMLYIAWNYYGNRAFNLGFLVSMSIQIGKIHIRE